MGRQVWKYDFAIEGETCIAMPSSAQILCVQVQNGSPRIWALVDPLYIGGKLAYQEARYFKVYGTGESMLPGEHTYIGTFQLRGGAEVYHLFERV